MKRRENILKSINHIKTNKIPIGFDIFDPLKSKVLNYYGVKELWQLYEKAGIEAFSVWDWPSAQPIYKGPSRKHVSEYDKTAAFGFWGKVGEHVYPLKNDTLDKYRWPEVYDFDFSRLKADLLEIRQKDMTTASGHAGFGWLHHVQMRSYDNVFYDVLDEEWMKEYLERNREFAVKYFTKLFESADGLIDIIRADEDLGGQDSMLISPDMWRKWYKPIWKEVFDICKKNGAMIWLHSCGYCRPLIDDFIEIGVDILNPLPPYVKDSKPEEMKMIYGDRLSFDGGVDQMNILVQGNPQDVEKEVKLRINQLSQKGGYIIGPSQVFTEDVPLENAISFFNAAVKYGSK